MMFKKSLIDRVQDEANRTGKKKFIFNVNADRTKGTVCDWSEDLRRQHRFNTITVYPFDPPPRGLLGRILNLIQQ